MAADPSDEGLNGTATEAPSSRPDRRALLACISLALVVIAAVDLLLWHGGDSMVQAALSALLTHWRIVAIHHPEVMTWLLGVPAVSTLLWSLVRRSAGARWMVLAWVAIIICNVNLASQATLGNAVGEILWDLGWLTVFIIVASALNLFRKAVTNG